jgi:hypothetical protein
MTTMYLLVVATQIILDMLVNMTVNTEQLSMAHANVTIVIMIIPAHYHAPALGTVLMGHVEGIWHPTPLKPSLQTH